MPKLKASSAVDETRQNLLFTGALIVVVVLFYTAYSFGTSKQKAYDTVKIHDITLRGQFLRKELRECLNKTGLTDVQAEKLEEGVAELWNTNQRLEFENEKLVKANEELADANIACNEGTESKRLEWRAEDEKYAPRLERLDKRNRELRNNAKRLSSTQGMRAILLLAVTKKLMEENAYLRTQNSLQTRSMSPKYLDDLVKKWKGKDARAMADRKGEVLPPNRTERWRASKVLRKYDPDLHAKDLFLPKRDKETGEWPVPGWNGRQGTQTVRHGTFVNSRLCPITDVNRQMRVLYEYALCAVGNNVTQLMYPSAFKRCKTCHTEYLHNYIETPLVLFCDDCVPMHTTNEFRLLCRGYSSEEQYGSTLFWRTRSRLRFKSRYLDLAQDWLERSGFTAWNVQTLAVRLPWVQQEENCKKLASSQRAILSYSKLLKGQNGVVEYSSDFEGRCRPSLDFAVEKIQRKYDELSEQRTRDVKVFISTDMDKVQFRELSKRFKFPLLRFRSTGRPTDDDIIDTYIAAGCKNAILNRFDIKSAHINEGHMLLHDLAPAGVTVW